MWSRGDRGRRGRETGKRLKGTASSINILLSAMGTEEGPCPIQGIVIIAKFSGASPHLAFREEGLRGIQRWSERT